MSGDPAVLVVEDDPQVREALGQTLDLSGVRAILTGSFLLAKDHIGAAFEGIVLTDIRMPGRDGLYLLDYTRTLDPDLPVILLTGQGDIPMAVDAMGRGAFDFLEKPCSNETLMSTIRRALAARKLVMTNRSQRAEMADGDAATRMIYGQSDNVAALRMQARRIASVEGPVLVTGAPGAGIAKVAEVIHVLSGRAAAPFRRVAAAGLTPEALATLLGAAADGALFLDGVERLPPEAQIAVMAHIERGRGARIYAGTTASLIDDPTFASDLSYALAALHVTIPPLSARPEDIPVIFQHYVREASAQCGVEEPPVPPELVADLLSQDWPGNTASLKTAAMRFVLGLGADNTGAPLGLAETLAHVERTLLITALKRNGGNATGTAEALKLPRKTLYDKFQKHGIKPDRYR